MGGSSSSCPSISTSRSRVRSSRSSRLGDGGVARTRRASSRSCTARSSARIGLPASSSPAASSGELSPGSPGCVAGVSVARTKRPVRSAGGDDSPRAVACASAQQERQKMPVNKGSSEYSQRLERSRHVCSPDPSLGRIQWNVAERQSKLGGGGSRTSGSSHEKRPPRGKDRGALLRLESVHSPQ